MEKKGTSDRSTGVQTRETVATSTETTQGIRGLDDSPRHATTLPISRQIKQLVPSCSPWSHNYTRTGKRS